MSRESGKTKVPMIIHGIQRAWQEFGCSRSGGTMLEYALLLGLLVGSGLAVYHGLATRVHGPLEAMARAFTSDGQPGHALDGATRDLLAEAGDWRTRSDSPTGKFLPTMQDSLIPLWLFLWVATALGLLALWRCIRRFFLGLTKKSDEPSAKAPLPPGAEEHLVEKRQQIRRLLLHHFDNAMGFETQVQHLMSKHVLAIRANTPSHQVAEKMRHGKIRHLLVCGKDGKLLGIISDRDLAQRGGQTASDIMTPEPVAVSPEMPVGPAITIMLGRGISCLPIVHENQVLGVLTTTDLLMSLQCMLQMVVAEGSTASTTEEITALEPELAVAEENGAG